MKLLQKLTKEQIDPYFMEWEVKALHFAELHKRRDMAVESEMMAGIELYRALLAHCLAEDNEKPLMPLNGEERLSFIVSRPGTFHAFRQLDELFSEMKKLIAAKRVQLKRIENA